MKGHFRIVGPKGEITRAIPDEQAAKTLLKYYLIAHKVKGKDKRAYKVEPE